MEREDVIERVTEEALDEKPEPRLRMCGHALATEEEYVDGIDEVVGCEAEKIEGKECEHYNNLSKLVLTPFADLECGEYNSVLLCSTHDNEYRNSLTEEIAYRHMKGEDYSERILGPSTDDNPEVAFMYRCGHVEFDDNHFEGTTECPDCESELEKVLTHT